MDRITHLLLNYLPSQYCVRLYYAMFVNISISESEIYHFMSSLHLINNVVVSFGSRDKSTSQCLLHDVVDQDLGQDSLHQHLQSKDWREAV